jgi:hypothetical protein
MSWTQLANDDVYTTLLLTARVTTRFAATVGATNQLVESDDVEQNTTPVLTPHVPLVLPLPLPPPPVVNDSV